MKLSSRKNLLLENKFILYFAFFSAIIQSIYFIQNEEILYLILFLGLAVLISRYNKNMIVIFILSIIVINLVKSVYITTVIKEGLDDAATTTTDKPSQLNAQNAQEQVNTAVDTQNKLLQQLNDMYLDITKKNANLQSTLSKLEIADAKVPTVPATADTATAAA